VATRRKYYRDGGAVNPDNHSGADVARPAVEVQPAASHDDDPVKRGLAEIKRAEELHRQQPQPQQPQLSQFKLDFLAAYPELVKDEEATTLTRYHYLSALRRGIPDDSPQMNEAILSGWRRMSAAHMPAPDAHRQARSDAIEREADQMDELAPTSASMKAPKFTSAPVSRNIPSASGGSVPMRITLSPEERDVARKSYSHLPPADAERLYHDMKRKMLIARANGTLNE
jgi:hypothetical protein